MDGKLLHFAAGLLGIAAIASCVNARSAERRSEQGPCRWRVVAIRDARPDESPFEASLRYAPDPAHRNEVSGPDSLRLAVRTTKGYYPHVFLEDVRTGDAHVAVPGSLSYLPAWSPDGRFFACVLQDSVSRLQSLAVVDRKAGRVTRFAQCSSVIDYKWSPNASFIALHGHARATRQITLFWMRVADGSASPVDTLDITADYDFTWSPDSRRLAFSKPTEISDHEDVLSADLWIAEREGTAKCRLIVSPEAVEQRPRWITDVLLLFESAPVHDGTLGVAQSKVGELKIASTARR